MLSTGIQKIVNKIKWKTLPKEVRIAQSLKGKLKIITYHGVVNKVHRSLNARFVTKLRLEADLKLYQMHCHVVSLKQCLNHDLSPNQLNILLTFDDGYENNFTVAAPLLQRFEFPAIFFVTANDSGKYPMLWTDFLDLAKRMSIPTLRFSELSFNLSRGRYKSDNLLLATFLKQCTGNEIEQFFYDNQQECQKVMEHGDFEPYWKLMTEDQIKGLNQSENFSIGYHSKMHNSFNQLNASEINRDLEYGKNWMKKMQLGEPFSFAFPFGDYNADVINLVANKSFIPHFVSELNLKSDKEKLKVFPRMMANPFISAEQQLNALAKWGE